MKGNVGAVLTSGLAAIAFALALFLAAVLAHVPPASSAAVDARPASYGTPGRGSPWSPQRGPAIDREGGSKPREEHRTRPPRNRGLPLEPGPRAPRRAVA